MTRSLLSLGYIPGHIHAFWLIYKKMQAEERYGNGGFLCESCCKTMLPTDVLIAYIRRWQWSLPAFVLWQWSGPWPTCAAVLWRHWELISSISCKGGSSFLSFFGSLFVNLYLVDIQIYYLFLRLGETVDASLVRITFSGDS